ncbi:MAG: sulfur carrier protein [Solirubrobacteraceae bacterium]|nr:sulfur carrier protein [Solirubrobacteraceae bacterium]
MNVVLNGEPRELLHGATLDDAIEASGAPDGRRGVAVALDGEVVPRGEWGTTTLAEGARVEVLQAVQGG